MTFRQRLALFLLWLANIALLVAICLPTGLHDTLANVIHRGSHNIPFYCVVGMVLARLEMYLYFKLKGE